MFLEQIPPLVFIPVDGGGGRDGGGTEGGECGGAVGGAEATDTATATASKVIITSTAAGSVAKRIARRSDNVRALRQGLPPPRASKETPSHQTKCAPVLP